MLVKHLVTEDGDYEILISIFIKIFRPSYLSRKQPDRSSDFARILEPETFWTVSLVF